MDHEVLTKPPTWFLVVAGIALVWNLIGAIIYVQIVTLSPESLAALPQDQQVLLESRPAWVMVAFAISVFGGSLGCILLLMKKSLAAPILSLSLLGVLVQMVHSFFMTNTPELLGIIDGLVMPILVIFIALFLVRLARLGLARGWIT